MTTPAYVQLQTVEQSVKNELSTRLHLVGPVTFDTLFSALEEALFNQFITHQFKEAKAGTCDGHISFTWPEGPFLRKVSTPGSYVVVDDTIIFVYVGDDVFVDKHGGLYSTDVLQDMLQDLSEYVEVMCLKH